VDGSGESKEDLNLFIRLLCIQENTARQSNSKPIAMPKPIASFTMEKGGEFLADAGLFASTV
jgi:hypothetical protein